MAENNLNLRNALNYLTAELKKRAGEYGAKVAELRKKEAAAGLSKDEGASDDLEMSEEKGFDKKPVPFKYQASCDNCGSDVHDKDEMLCPKCKPSVKKDEVPASERVKGSVLPDDKLPKKACDAEGSGGDVKKLKKDAMAPKASPPPIPGDAKPKASAPKAAPAAAPPKTPAMGAGTPQAPKAAPAGPKMAGAAIPPPSPGMAPMKLPGLTLPKGPGVSPPVKTNARLGKEELGKTGISGHDQKVQAAKKPGAAASAGKLMDTMLAAPAPAPLKMGTTLPASGAAQLAGVGQPAGAAHKGVQTMVERAATNMAPPGAAPAGPPRVALPGASLFAKPTAVPPPIPADAKPAAKPVK